MLELERAEFEAELGTWVRLVEEDPGDCARWLLVVDERYEGAPCTTLDAGSRLLVSRAADVGGLFEAMSLLRTVARRGASLEAAYCTTIDDVVECVVDEVADTYRAFALRGFDWDEICARHVERVRGADDLLPALQEWLAELQDGHTWAWPPMGNLPYAISVDDAATFVRVREGRGDPRRRASIRDGRRARRARRDVVT